MQVGEQKKELKNNEELSLIKEKVSRKRTLEDYECMTDDDGSEPETTLNASALPFRNKYASRNLIG